MAGTDDRSFSVFCLFFSQSPEGPKVLHTLSYRFPILFNSDLQDSAILEARGSVEDCVILEARYSILY